MSLYRLYIAYNMKKKKELQNKMAYCNNNVIPLLIENNIKWDEFDTRRIVIRGKVFPIMYIDNGKVEDFIQTLIQGRQSTLDEF